MMVVANTKTTEKIMDMIKCEIPPGIILTETGYRVFKPNGDDVKGFVDVNHNYYELVINQNNRTWYTIDKNNNPTFSLVNIVFEDQITEESAYFPYD